MGKQSLYIVLINNVFILNTAQHGVLRCLPPRPLISRHQWKIGPFLLKKILCPRGCKFCLMSYNPLQLKTPAKIAMCRLASKQMRKHNTVRHLATAQPTLQNLDFSSKPERGPNGSCLFHSLNITTQEPSHPKPCNR